MRNSAPRHLRPWQVFCTLHFAFPAMSSFSNPHYLYLFAMTNGKKKLAYGGSPEEAYHILELRLTEKEMREIDKDHYIRIAQRELREHIHELG